MLSSGAVAVSIRTDASALEPPAAVCIGAFDGLHRGHQALFAQARTHADRLALVTFDPHPAVIIAPERAPRLLHSPSQRARVAAELGIDTLVLLPFDRAMSKQAAETFVQQTLIDGLRPAAVLVGEDFRFGAGRKGNTETLANLLRPAGITFEAVAPVPLSEGATGDGKLSSSDIRRAIEAGDVERAGALLGRWHAVAGTVVHGAKRGRTLGYPTANLAPEGGMAPPTGIYASALSVCDPASPDAGEVWAAVTSIGHNPTFTETGSAVTIETYVLDEDLGERLYGVAVEVSFISRLRAEIEFDGVDPLVAQIRDDVERSRARVDAAALARVANPGVGRR